MSSVDFLHLFFAIAIGQGFFMAFVFLTKAKNENSSLVFLSTFLLAFSLVLVYWLGFWRNLYVDNRTIDFLAGPTDLLLGPLLYFFVKSNIESDFKIGIKEMMHFVPYLLLILFNINTAYWLASGTQLIKIFTFDGQATNVYQSITLLKPFLFLIYTIWIIHVAWKKQVSWIMLAAIAFSLFTIGSIVYSIMVVFFQYSLVIDYMISVVIVFSIYSISYTVNISPNFFGKKKRAYERSSLSHQHEPHICKTVLDHLNKTKSYLQVGYSQEALTADLGIPKHHISQAINHHMNKSFNELINEMRIENAKQMLKDAKLENVKILAVAFDSGFNNKVSFYQHFKRLTGKSPKEFRETFV